jgi:hypothetical protein
MVLNEAEDESTVFEDIIDAYGVLAQRLQELMVRSINKEVTDALKAYTRK